MSDEFKNYHIIDLQNGNALISRKQQLTASQKPLQSDEIAINILVDQIQKLKQQLEAVEKENRGLKMMLNHVAEVEHICEDLEAKLTEAVEVIEKFSTPIFHNGTCDTRDSEIARQFLAKYRGGEMSKIFIYSDNESDVSWENVFLSTKYKDLKHFKKENPDLRPIVSYNVKDVIGVDVDELEQELAKLKKENEKFRKMLQDNEDKYIEYRDDLYYEISKLKELLRRFVPHERTIQWEQREIDARDFLKKYDMAIGHDFRSERLKKHKENRE